MHTTSTEGTWPVDNADPEMAAAIRAALDSIAIFFQAFADPTPEQTSFLLKIRFVDGSRAEHIWLADVDFTTMPGTGIVANETSFPGLSYMQRAPFEPSQITDWMYFDEGKLVGGFTTRLLLRRSKPQ